MRIFDPKQMDKSKLEEIIKLYAKKPTYRNLIVAQDTCLVRQLRSCTSDTVLYSNTRLLEIQKLVKENYEAPSFTEDILKAYGSVQKQIPKQYKYLRQTNVVLNAKKVSTCCMQHLRRSLSRTSKTNPYLKSKRVGKELNVYYKKTKRNVDKKEMEEKEAVRQKKKLNFLINQTEIFGHFMMKKGKIDLEVGVGTEAAKKQLDWINEFDKKDINAHKDAEMDGLEQQKSTNTQETAGTYVQKPDILNATLKGYQLQGLRWLVNLYDQGINGILADDMGLGKTVQSIAFLAHLREKEEIEGPFLIITPASTLHNWINEFTKFLPSFKVVSYWGSINERKLLRKQFSTSNVIVTSYQMVVTDEKLFKRIKWQYMILDEAQAIKSSTSLRWKTLLSIACRNRLLLTGTPVQNTMGELWALLHFIMPTLFDSHEEFSTWFSKDIEKEGKNIDDIQLQRLHMILKPFMLRREKDDVKDELGIKTEKDIYCEMSIRQKKLYKTIGEQKSIDIEDISDVMKKMEMCDEKQDKPVADDMLLNLIMQYRKVCNHPDLFEREEVRSGFCFEVNDHLNTDYISGMHRSLLSYQIPKVVGDLIVETKSNKLINFFNITRNEYLYNLHQSKNNFEDNNETGDRNIGENDTGAININNTKKLDLNSSIAMNEQRKRRKLNETNEISDEYEAIYDVISKIQNHCHFNRSNSLDLNTNNLDNNHKNNHTFYDNEYTFASSSNFYKNNDSELFENYESVDNNDNYSTYSIFQQNFTQKNHIQSMLSEAIPCISKNKLQVEVSNMLKCRRESLKLYSNMYIPSILATAPKINTTSNLLLRENERHDRANELPFLTNNIYIPRLNTFISDSGKLLVIDALLRKLKAGGHRVLIYFQMTKMMDLMEDYLVKRGYTYCRLDGSSRLNVRRDVVNNWQTSDEKFVFILSTRAGGLGINLTAADTVIFYDSDWNPTVDQQAMDRAHRLGQTKDVTVYRLITRNTIEERVIARAARKGEIQKMVIQGGEFGLKDLE